MERERRVTWTDPMVSARAARTMPGLSFLRAIVSGDISPPPVGALVGMRLVQVDEGSAVFSLDPDESHYNPIGTVHGGVIATICDSAASCAVHSALPAGVAYTTLELKINYVRPVTGEAGPLTCSGRVIHAGRRVRTAEARLHDTAGKLYAHATVTCIIFEATPEG